MTNKIIQEQGVAEVLLIDQDNCVTEGSRSNVFFIRDNVFYTAPLPHVLPGTSRKRVLNICQEDGLTVVEQRVNYKDIASLSSSLYNGDFPTCVAHRSYRRNSFRPAPPIAGESYGTLLQFIK